jgi:hypothetical protein
LKRQDQYGERETVERREAAMKRMLSTPPKHKTKAKPNETPKKRGRPKKEDKSAD